MTSTAWNAPVLIFSAIGDEGMTALASLESNLGPLHGTFMDEPVIAGMQAEGAEQRIFAMPDDAIARACILASVGQIAPGLSINVKTVGPGKVTFWGAGAQTASHCIEGRLSPPRLPDAWADAFAEGRIGGAA